MGERKQIRIALGGDAMLGRGVAAQLATTGPDGLVSGEVRDYLSGADLAVLNLECCISERGRPWEGAGKRFHFRAPPAAARSRFILPSSSAKMRSPAILSAIHVTCSGVSCLPTPSSTSRPRSMAPATRPPMVTRARETR